MAESITKDIGHNEALRTTNGCTNKLEALAVPFEEDPFEALHKGGEFINDMSGPHLDKAMAIKA